MVDSNLADDIQHINGEMIIIILSHLVHDVLFMFTQYKRFDGVTEIKNHFGRVQLEQKYLQKLHKSDTLRNQK